MDQFFSSRPSPLSNIADLAIEDFRLLCSRAVKKPDDYCDYQLVCCFQKLNDLDHRSLDLLQDFFRLKQDSYTKRMVVHALARFKLPETIPLIEQLWSNEDCEFAKISCLYSLEPFPDYKPLFDQYLLEYKEMFPEDQQPYRKSHLDRFQTFYS